MSDQLIDDLIRAYLGEKIKRCNILNQNGANLVYLHGKDLGRKLGLPEDDLQGITPFPASTKIVIDDNETKASEEKSGEKTESTTKPWTRRILPWVLGSAIGLAGGVGSMFALRPDQEEQKPPIEEVVKPPEEVVVEPPVEDPINPNVGLEIRGQKQNER